MFINYTGFFALSNNYAHFLSSGSVNAIAGGVAAAGMLLIVGAVALFMRGRRRGGGRGSAGRSTESKNPLYNIGADDSGDDDELLVTSGHLLA